MSASTIARSADQLDPQVVYEIEDLWRPAGQYEAEMSQAFEMILTKFSLIDLAIALLEVRLRPKTACGFEHGFMKVRHVWDLMQSIRRHGFQPPPGDEIMVRSGGLMPHNGTHRAAILFALGMPAPAIVIDNYKTFTPRRHTGEPPWQS